MKICPRCQKTYTDNNLNFCLEDGATLTITAGNMPNTVAMNQPPVTNQPPTSGQPAWNVQPQFSNQPPKKSSKTWVWVLLIIGGLILLCGGGGLGLLVYIGSQVENTANVDNTNKNSKGDPTSNKASNSSTSTSTSSRDKVDSLDLSKWVQDDQSFGNTEFTDGEFTMSSRKRGFYYVLAGAPKQISVNADSRVTVRNLNNEDTNLGFGLVFHSNTTPLQQGYAFLIDSKKGRYRVVHHSPKTEDPVINWTRSDAIKDGTSPNTIEVRDGTDTIDLYINDKKVNSIRNVYGYPNGVVGLYVADAMKIGFKDLEIRK